MSTRSFLFLMVACHAAGCAGRGTAPTTPRAASARARGQGFEVPIPEGFVQAQAGQRASDLASEVISAAGGVKLATSDLRAQIALLPLAASGSDPNASAESCAAFGAALRQRNPNLSGGLIKIAERSFCRFEGTGAQHRVIYTVLSAGSTRVLAACHAAADRPTAEKACNLVVGAWRATPGGNATSAPRATVALYIMSKCPYGVEAMQGVSEMLRKVGDRVTLSVDYIVSRKGKEFSSMHGSEEVTGDIVQLCARALYPEQAKWLPFFDCVNGSWQQIPANTDHCASKLGLDSARLKACVGGAQGQALLAASHVRAEAANASGSPTIVIHGEEYGGGRSGNDFVRAICGKLQGPPTAACRALPAPVRVATTILSDKRCTKGCEVERLEANLRERYFPGMVTTHLDYGSKEGKALYERLGLKGLPAVLFGSKVRSAERFAQLARWLEPRKEFHLLRIPAPFDPKAEICDNKIDDTGNGKIDCQDPSCEGRLVCRPERPRELTVFVMSQCPYGVQGINAMRELFGAFGKGIKFDLHYIAASVGQPNCDASKAEQGFCALHGASEVQENIRQLCAKKLYRRNNKYLDYIWCRNGDIRSNNWEGCAKGGIDARRIKHCVASGLGARLHAADIKLAQTLKIGGSPTWLSNNRHKFHGVAADEIKTKFCKHNPGLKGCEKTLSKEAAAQGACGQ